MNITPYVCVYVYVYNAINYIIFIGWMLRVAPIREPSEVVGHWELYNEMTEQGRKSKKIFYFNRKTFETSYDKPKEIEEAESLQKKTANFSYNNFSGYQDESGNWIDYNDSYYNSNQYDGGYYDDQGYYYDNSNYNNADVMTSKGGHNLRTGAGVGVGVGVGVSSSSSSRFPPISSRPSARNGGGVVNHSHNHTHSHSHSHSHIMTMPMTMRTQGPPAPVGNNPNPASSYHPGLMSSRSQRGSYMTMTNTNTNTAATGGGGGGGSNAYAHAQLPKLPHNAAEVMGTTLMGTIPGDDSGAMMMTTNGGYKSKKPALSKRGLPLTNSLTNHNL